MTSPDKIVRRWVTSCPGMFEGVDHVTVLRAAYASAGVSQQMALSEFGDCLRRMGHVPKEIRAGLWRLILPDAKSVGVKPRVYHD